MTTSQDNTCKERAKAARDKRLKEARDKGGEVLYNAIASSYNTFVDILQQEVNAVVAVLEPIITLDKFIFDNFVKPPLSAVKSAAKVAQKTIKIPAAMIGAVSSACEQEANNQKAVNKVEQFLTQDLDHLQNKLDNFEYHSIATDKTLQALKDLPDSVDGLRAPSYQEFKDSL